MNLLPRKQSHLPMLRFHNTLSGEIEAFEPLSSSEVKMYNCGPTVYDRQHIGNLRAYVFADTLRRSLEYWHYSVKQVINITDVGHLTSDGDEGEDKIEAAAEREHRTAKEIAEQYTSNFFADLDEVGVDRQKALWPRATQFIPEQIALVRTLEEKGYAYRTKDGVYFDTSRFPSYGKLGGIRLSMLKEGARVAENPYKRNPYDFALWKRSPSGKRREQEWDSPWGKGFPGWHIECTAMIFKLLGKQIDIHTGGIDHIPVHHNNEIAQAEAITGKRYVKYWMHNEFITIEGKKVSKSLGNTVYLYQITDRGLSARSLRYWFLTGHYRSPMNFTWEAIEASAQALSRLNRLFFEELAQDGASAKEGASPDPDFMRAFCSAIADDLNTPQALACVWNLAKDAAVPKEAKCASLLEADRVLNFGFAEERPSAKVPVVAEEDLPPEVREALRQREAARREKNFIEADRLRARLGELGYDVVDTAEGTQVKKK